MSLSLFAEVNFYLLLFGSIELQTSVKHKLKFKIHRFISEKDLHMHAVPHKAKIGFKKITRMNSIVGIKKWVKSYFLYS